MIFLKCPPYSRTLDVSFDVCGSFAHFASWLSMKLPHGWRRPIRIADAGGRDPVDGSAALAVIRVLAVNDSRGLLIPVRRIAPKLSFKEATAPCGARPFERAVRGQLLLRHETCHSFSRHHGYSNP